MSRIGTASLAALVAILLTTGCSDKLAKAYAEGQTAQALFDAGNLPAARSAIGRALALRDDQIELLLLDGRIKFRMSDFNSAFDSYNLALAIDPSNQEALEAVSQIGISIGYEKESEEATDKILAVDPNQPGALLVKGVIALNKRKYEDAKQIGEKMLAADPKSESGVVLKARAMFKLGERKEAFAILNDALKSVGRSQMITTALLECARDQADAPVMIDQYRVLSEFVPKNADLTIDEANVQYKSGNIEEARARGYALITENGDKADAMERLGNLWSEYDNDPLTRAQLSALASDGPAEARIMAARHYLAKGDAAIAAELVGPLRTEDVAGLKLRINYVAKDSSAESWAEKLLKTDTTNCDALVVRYAAQLNRREYTQAVISAQMVPAECPDRVEGYLMLAQAYNLSGNAAGVRRAYSEGIDGQPLDTTVTAKYADWLFGQKRADTAVAIATRLTQRAPAKVSAWRLLTAVCTRAGDRACVQKAQQGEATARKTFQIDLPPGERRPNPLLGNSWR